MASETEGSVTPHVVVLRSRQPANPRQPFEHVQKTTPGEPPSGTREEEEEPGGPFTYRVRAVSGGGA